MTSVLPTGPLSLKGFIDYQPGSVVSKEVLRTPNGTVTLFAFDQDQGLSEHTAPFDVVTYIVEGEAEITISGTTYTVNEGEMIRPPDEGLRLRRSPWRRNSLMRGGSNSGIEN